jgi:hypothetical protein
VKAGGPLPRYQPLTARTPLVRKKPMPRQSRRRRREVAAEAGVLSAQPRRTPAPRRFTEATRRLIYARDEKCCVRCGIYIPSAPWSGSAQHRCARGMGGTTVAWRQRPANGILLCGSGTTGCHGWVEAHGRAAEACGWRLEHGELTADRWPVLYASLGEIRLLDDHGDFTVLACLEEWPGPQFTVGAYMPAA